MTITTCCKIWWICHGKNIERTVDGQTNGRKDGRTVRHTVSVSVSVKCCCCAAPHGQCGVAALHVTIASPTQSPSPSPSFSTPWQHTTYPHRLPQLARRQSHFTPTKLRKWQANEPSKAILFFFVFCCFSFKFCTAVFVVVVLTLDAQ